MFDVRMITQREYTSGGYTIYYCPSCQTRGRVLKDRRLSSLLR